jgi:TRAP-type C4-dicarboxylate transport system permease small subunit
MNFQGVRTVAFVVKKAPALEKGIRTAENVIAAIGGVMLLVMMLLGAADVIGRYGFNSPISGAINVSQLMMGGVVFFGWAYTLSKKSHVTVDIAFNHYPRRAQAIIEFVMLILSLLLFSLIIWQSILIAIKDWQVGNLVNVIRIPITPFKLFIPFGAFFLCLESIIQMVHLVPQMRRKEED